MRPLAIKFRTFNVIEDYNREVWFVETDYSLKSSRVIWVLIHQTNKYGKPAKIRMDNGPEFIANLAKAWSRQMRSTLGTFSHESWRRMLKLNG